jgi:hypothetical protein
MEPFFSIVAFLFHLIFFFYITGQLINSMWFHKRQERKFKIIHTITEVLLLFLLIFCFLLVDMSSFDNEKYFGEFAGILLLSIALYGINKLDFGAYKNLKKHTSSFVGTLFWLSLFTFFKFAPYLPYSWFPLLGLMALAPFFFVLLSISEINYQTQLDPKNSVYKTIAFGLIPLIILQLIMNLYTPEPWELIKIFDPASTTIF